MPSGSPNKEKRRTMGLPLSDGQRQRLIAAAGQGTTVGRLAEQYGLPEKIVKEIIHNSHP